MKLFKSSLILSTFLLSFTLLSAPINGGENDKISLGENGQITFIKLDPENQVGSENRLPWLGKLLKLSNNESFALKQRENDKYGFTHYNYNQEYKGIRVEDAVYKIHVKNGFIVSANGNYASKINTSTTPSINGNNAILIAKKSIRENPENWLEEGLDAPELVIFKTRNNIYKLTYKVDIYSTKPLARKYVYVDAISGKVIGDRNRIHDTDVPGTCITKYQGVKTITTDSIAGTYRLTESGRGGGITTKDLNNSTSYGSAVHFEDTDNYWDETLNQDDAALDAHYGAEVTYDYYFNNFGRNSYDNAGTEIESFVHYSSGYVNAFWDGNRMTYGDGNGITSTALTSIDIVGHEITHAVTEHTAGLIYSYESGALNESFSDIFGVIVDFDANPSTANYLVGEQIYVDGHAFRSMENPNLYGDPDTYLGTNWHTSSSDAGGVHTNSGVQNFWFYLLVNGGTGVNDIGNSYTVPGIGMSSAAAIAYRNLSVYLTPTSNYTNARQYAIQSAIDLFGECSPEVAATTNAWYAVGVGAEYSSAIISAFTVDQTFSCSVPGTINFTNTSLNADSYVWHFGDGSTSTAENPSHTYTTAGTYTVELISTGIALCGTSDTLTLIDYINITEVGTPIPPSCQPITTTGGASYGIFNFNLAGIDNSSSGSTDGYVDYTCIASTNLTEGIFYPISIITGAVSPEDVKVWIDFDNNGVFNDLDELVFFSDNGTTYHEGNIIIPSGAVYDTPLSLRVGSELSVNTLGDACTNVTHGQFEDYSVVILENTNPPNVNFVVDDSIVNLDQILSFTDLTENLPTSWSWEFTGASTPYSSLQDLTNSYPTEGTYPVKLIASNSYGSDSLTKLAYISVNAIYEICTSADSTNASSGFFLDSGGESGDYSSNENCSFLINPTCALDVTLSFIQFYSPTSSDIMRIYDGMDNTAPLLATYNYITSPPAAIVATSGSMYIEWTSNGSSNYSGWDARWSSTLPLTDPVANFSTSDVTPLFATPVVFTDLTTAYPGSWLWSFGDGTNSTLQNPTHAYTTSGIHTVQLIANNCISLDTASYDITVDMAPASIISSDTIFATLACGDSTQVTLPIENTGPGILTYEIDSSISSAVCDSTSYIEFTTSGATTSHFFSGNFSGADSIHLEISILGDFDNTTEYASFSIDGSTPTIIVDGDPSTTTVFVSNYSFTESEIATWVTDNMLTINVINTSAVDIFSTSFHQVKLTVYKDTWITDITPTEGTILAGDTTNVILDLTANGLIAGEYFYAIEINTNDTLNPIVTVPVNLSILGSPEISFSDLCLDFGTIYEGTTAEDDITIFNSGCDTLFISNILADDSQYIADTTNLFIPPYDSLTFTVTFAPVAPGTFNATMQVFNTDVDSSFCLIGSALDAPVIVLNPDTLNATVACSDSTLVPFNVLNLGGADLDWSIATTTLTEIDFESPLDFSIWNSVLGGNTANSCGVNSGINALYFNGSGNRRATTNPFNFTSGGTISFHLKIATGSSGSFCEDADPGEEVVLEYSLDGSLWNNINTYSTTAFPSFTLIEENIPLVAQTASTSIRWRQLSNSGSSTDNWSIDDVTIASVESTFDVSPNMGTIIPGDSTEVSIQVSSEGLLAGTYDYIYFIESNDPVNPLLTFPLNLTVVGDPSIEFSDLCLDFGTIFEGTTAENDITLFNTGCDTLFVTNILGDDTQYTADTTNFQILPNDSFNITVTFAPLSPGIFNSNMQVFNNDLDTLFCLKGISLDAPVIALNPDTLNVTLNCSDSIDIPFDIINEGGSDLNWIISPTSNIETDFETGIDTDLWNNVIGGSTTNSCGVNSGLNALYFNGSFARTATTNPFNFSSGGTVNFHLKIATGGGAACEDADPGEEIVLEYSLDGSLWTIINTYSTSLFPTFTFVEENIPLAAQTPSTSIRWRQLSNSGSANDHWSIDDVSITGEGTGFSVSPDTGITLAGDTSTVITTITSDGLIAGTYSYEYIINSNDPVTPSIQLPLNLTVIGDPTIEFSDNCLDFGSIFSGTTATDSILIKNTGCDTLHVTSLLAADSEYTTTPTSFYILPFDSLMVEVIFAPLTPGVFNSTIQLFNNDIDSLFCVLGTSLEAPIVGVYPDTLNVSINCTDSTTVPFYVLNEGGSILDWTIASTSAFDTDFETGIDTDLWNNVIGGAPANTCGVNGGLNALYFNGATTRTATTNPFNFNGGGTVSFFLKIATGSGSFCENADPGEEVVLEYSLDGFSWTNINTYGVDVFPTFSFVEENMPLAAQTPSTMIRWRQISSSGSTNDHWSIDDVSVTAIGSDYTATPDYGSTPAGDSTLVNIAISAEALIAGSYTYEYVITSNDPLTPLLTLPVNITVSGSPSIEFADDCLDFGEIFIGQSASDSVMLYNKGCDTLFVTSIFADDLQYTASPTNFFITSGDSAWVNVIFTPTSAGVFNANLQINNTDIDSILCLLGVAIIPPVIDTDQEVISLTVSACDDSIDIPLTLYNTGGSVLDWMIFEDVTLFSDDFESGIDYSLWSSVSGGAAAGSCGTNSGTNALYFNSSSTRNATTNELTTSFGGTIGFYLKIATGSSSPCEDADPGEEVSLEYSNDGIAWTNINTYATTGYPIFTYIEETIPSGAETANTRFRWRQINNSGVGTDNWSIDDVTIDLGGTTFSATPSSGAILSGDSSLISIQFLTADLNIGSNLTTLYINSNDPETPTYEVIVDLNLTPNLCADFTFASHLSCTGGVDFTSSAINDPISWIWDFGDGNTSSTANPTHYYADAGDYTVELTICNETFCETIIHTVTSSGSTGPIFAACNPTAVISGSAHGITQVTFNTINHFSLGTALGYEDLTCTASTEVIEGDTYDISINTSSPNTKNVLGWIDFNNNGIFTTDELVLNLTDSNPVHTGSITIPYGTTYNIPLRMRIVSDLASNPTPSSCTNVFNGEFEDYTVTIFESTLPISNFSQIELNDCGSKIGFTDESLNSPTEWLWDFGDENFSTTQNPSHIYNNPGTYVITLTATNALGSTVSSSTVTITEAITPINIITDPPLLANTIIYFESVIEDAFLYNWGFGDGYSSALQSPNHYYPLTGDYDLTLFVVDADYCLHRGETTINLEQTASIISNEYNISIHPNPTHGMFRIINTSGMAIKNIEVLNSLGQIVYQSIATEGVDLNYVDDGIYYVTLYLENGQKLVEKLILQ